MENTGTYCFSKKKCFVRYSQSNSAADEWYKSKNLRYRYTVFVFQNLDFLVSFFILERYEDQDPIRCIGMKSLIRIHEKWHGPASLQGSWYLQLLARYCLGVRDVNVSIFFRSNGSIFFCTPQQTFRLFFCSNEKKMLSKKRIFSFQIL